MIDKDTLNAVSDPKFRQLCEETIDLMNRLPIPGVALGVMHGDEEHAMGFGVTSIKHPLPITPDTLFQVGSITKTFTATLIMRLIEMGKLDLDSPLRTYMPDLQLADENVAAHVTIRHLLTHTGGWVGDYFNDFGFGDDALAIMVRELAGLPQLTPLGEVWSYNNAGFNLAGRVVEIVTGQAYEAALQQLILDPLGLKMSFFFSHDVMLHCFVVGHEVVEHQPQVARPWPIGRAGHAVGGLVSTVKDLFRYARFHSGDGTAPDGTPLLARGSLKLMQTPMRPASGFNSIGLSWFITPIGHTHLIGHGGATNGQVALLRIVPDRKFAVVILTNSDEGDVLTYPIANSAVKSYLGLDAPRAVPIAVPAEKLTQYVGRYEAAAAIREITLKDSELILSTISKGGFPTPDSQPSSPPPPVRIALYADDKIVGLDEPMKDELGEFLRDADGHIIWFRFGGRVHSRCA